MKKTQFIELLSLVRHTFVPFFSIVLFIGMSITLYAGLTWTGESLQDRLNVAFEEANAGNFTVTSELGLTDSDLEKISELQGVSGVEAAYVSYQTIQAQAADADDSIYCCVNSITDQINKIDLLEGALPSGQNEIAILSLCAQYYGYKVGDTITFAADGGDASTNDGMKYLKSRTFTITGIVGSSDYLSNTLSSLGINNEGKEITCVFYADKGAFSADAYHDSHPVAYVTGAGLNALDSFGSAYEVVSGDVLASLGQAGETLALNRYNALKSEADSKVDEGQKQLDEAKAKITDAETQISDGETQLAEKRSELADAQAELDEKVAQATEEDREITAELADVQSDISQYREKLADMREQYSKGKEEIAYYTDMEASLKTLSSSILAEFEELISEAAVHKSDPDFQTWIASRCEKVNASTANEVAAFKKNYPTRPAELDELLDGLELDSTSIATSKKAAENAAGLGVAADKIQTDVVEPGQEKLDELKSAIDTIGPEIEEAQAQLDEKNAEYNAEKAKAESKLEAGRAQIAEGEKQLAEGEAELQDGKEQLADKKSQYADGEQKLDKLKSKAAELKPAKWYISDRNDAYAYQLAETTSQTLISLRLTMALLFIVVGLLVCYSVMARLVHEQTEQLGTKKALGFTLFEIAKLFLGYALLACICGTLIGVFVGAPVVQTVLIPRMNQYTFEPPGLIFDFLSIVNVSAVQILLICVFAWLACSSVLKKRAIELLAGYRASMAKRHFFEEWACWKRLGLLAQTMVNNCFNDKRRVFGTLVGVAGCTALIVCAITLQGGIRDTTNQQETVVERYDQVVYVARSDADASPARAKGSAQTVDDIIASQGYTSIRAQYDLKSVSLTDGSKVLVTFIVPENMDDLSKVMTVEVQQGDETLGQSGVYISGALASYYKYNVGDDIVFDSSDATSQVATVAGVFDYYGGTHVAIMSKDAYLSCFGSEADFTARLVSTGSDADAFAGKVKAARDFNGIVDSRETTHLISAMVNNLALTVVGIYIGISALVALFVLLNLNVMYIAEKKRELIVMMVNGYSVKDAKRYVSRDTLIMNALGMVIGCALGTGMGILAIYSLQNNRLAFIANISPFAWLVGIVICAVFSALVMKIALRKVDKFTLTSINE